MVNLIFLCLFTGTGSITMALQHQMESDMVTGELT